MVIPDDIQNTTFSKKVLIKPYIVFIDQSQPPITVPSHTTKQHMPLPINPEDRHFTQFKAQVKHTIRETEQMQSMKTIQAHEETFSLTGHRFIYLALPHYGPHILTKSSIAVAVDCKLMLIPL